MATSTPKPPRTWAQRTVRVVLVGAGGFVLLGAAYLWIAMTWSYSTGERAGYVQKFSKKGVISKTWEGELAMVSLPGTMPEKFYFTVSDDAVAAQVNETMGKKVSLAYDQHLGIPTTFFGETQYFVSKVRLVE